MKYSQDCVKSLRLWIRITAEERNNWKKYIEMKGIPLSEGMRIVHNEFFRKVIRNKNFPIELREYLEENIRKQKEKYDEKIRKQETIRLLAIIKERNYCYWLYSNTYKSILGIAENQYLSTGTINMEIINDQIDNGFALFDTFPDDIKRISKSTISNIELLRDPKEVIKQIHYRARSRIGYGIIKDVTPKQKELDHKKELEHKEEMEHKK